MDKIKFIISQIKLIEESSLTDEDLKIMVAMQLWENAETQKNKKSIEEIRQILKMQ